MKPSFYVQATKLRRKRRQSRNDSIIKRNNALLKEIETLDNKSRSLRHEIESLTTWRNPITLARNRDAVVNDSLKLQIFEYRVLVSKLRQHFMSIDENMARMEVLHVMKQNLIFLFQRMETELKQTASISKFEALNNSRSRFKRKVVLYQEMVKVLTRYYSYKFDLMTEDVDGQTVIDWLPEFDFSKLECKVADFQTDDYAKTIRLEIKDVPVPVPILQGMCRTIDYFTIVMMSSDALRKHANENDESVVHRGLIVFQDSYYLTLDLFPKNDNVVEEFSVSLTRPASLLSQDMALFSASRMADDTKSSSYVLQVPVKNPESVVLDEVEKGNLYFRGLSFKQGCNENTSDVTIIANLTRPKKEINDFTRSLQNLGGRGFMKKGQYDPFKVINYIEAILKVSLYFYTMQPNR